MSSLKISKGQVWVDAVGFTRVILNIDDQNVVTYKAKTLYGTWHRLTANKSSLSGWMKEDGAKLDKRSIINQFFNGD